MSVLHGVAEEKKSTGSTGSTGCPRKKVTDLVRASAKNLAQINHK